VGVAGLGHVTPTIFGSTVGYPSDSLAFCISGNFYFLNIVAGKMKLQRTEGETYKHSRRLDVLRC